MIPVRENAIQPQVAFYIQGVVRIELTSIFILGRYAVASLLRTEVELTFSISNREKTSPIGFLMTLTFIPESPHGKQWWDCNYWWGNHQFVRRQIRQLAVHYCTDIALHVVVITANWLKWEICKFPKFVEGSNSPHGLSVYFSWL